ncbi:hypothetical protein [Eggerthella sp. YY7918]|uniref:hypothetical protein n=1 Tax=Eggerthella sp. (strain YY7918) TaxID=502558 RepID=UPI00021716DB|nr:hypothetical protein [Eggerthella sp. YY7918]BAK45578.1 hypothetical protein EGYY_25130 [Eggerthella sp. YY7918]
MKRDLPPTPFIESVIQRRGSEYLFSEYFDDQLNPLPNAPDELKREAKLLQSIPKPQQLP